MTHAILDRQAHPYIVYKSGHQYAQFHIFLERVLDVLLLKEMRGQVINTWDQEGILAEICRKPPLGFQDFLAQALVMAFPERAAKDSKLGLRIDNTLADCAGFYFNTSPKRTTMDKIAFSGGPEWNFNPDSIPYLYPEELCEAGTGYVDFLNLEKRPWFYPLAGSEEDRRSFLEIYSDAITIAADSLGPVIIEYLETGIFPIAEAASIFGNGGLSIVDENGIPCTPNKMDPLPLEMVMKQQVFYRNIS
jgi:hypothetical protein